MLTNSNIKSLLSRYTNTKRVPMRCMLFVCLSFLGTLIITPACIMLQ